MLFELKDQLSKTVEGMDLRVPKKSLGPDIDTPKLRDLRTRTPAKMAPKFAETAI